jgi:hypothetical protein
MFPPLRHDVESQIVLIALSGGMGFEWKLDSLVVRDELFQVHRSECSSLINVNPELGNSLFRVPALGEFNHRAQRVPVLTSIPRYSAVAVGSLAVL